MWKQKVKFRYTASQNVRLHSWQCWRHPYTGETVSTNCLETRRLIWWSSPQPDFESTTSITGTLHGTNVSEQYLHKVTNTYNARFFGEPLGKRGKLSCTWNLDFKEIPMTCGSLQVHFKGQWMGWLQTNTLFQRTSFLNASNPAFPNRYRRKQGKCGWRGKDFVKRLKTSSFLFVDNAMQLIRVTLPDALSQRLVVVSNIIKQLV